MTPSVSEGEVKKTDLT